MERLLSLAVRSISGVALAAADALPLGAEARRVQHLRVDDAARRQLAAAELHERAARRLPDSIA